MIITATALRSTVPTLAPARAADLASKMDFILPKYGIASPGILHEFVANVAHESCAFRLKDENLNYKTAARLLEIWPSRFTTLEKINALKNQVSHADIKNRKTLLQLLDTEQRKASAEAYTGDARKLANLVYGGRMGNHLPDDGYNMRGGGFAQLTGREAYAEYRSHTGFDTVENVSKAVRTDDWWAMDCAAWFFAVKKGLIPLALKDDFLGIVKRWNGGYIGLADRKYYYERAQAFIK